jgi:acyl dehydratase
MSVYFESADEALALAGKKVGRTVWLTVTQKMVNEFAALTGDSQWIHVDTKRAAETPFGGCVAHGNFTLSLAGGMFFHELIRSSAKSAVNYGSDRVRFPAPVRVGRAIRGSAEVLEAKRLGDSHIQLKVRMTVEVDDEPKPACVADFIARYHF